PSMGPATPPLPARTNKGPTMGPVQENETITSVRAIKKMPPRLPKPALESVLLIHDEGSVISKAPKKEIPNMANMAKNTRLAIQFVDRLFRAFPPKTREINTPNRVKMMMMESEYQTALRIPSALVR